MTEENYSSQNDLNEIRRFEYDSLGRLVLSDIKDIVEESGNTSEENKLITEYSYDKVGNRLTKRENGEETAYVYNGLNQLLAETKGTDTLTYSYDSNGNQTGVTGTSDGETVSKTMTYTPGDMMETYSDGERVQHNTYAEGETRIRKEEGTSLQSLTDVTNYFYQEGSVLYTTGNDNDTKSFNLLNISDTFGTERTDESSKSYYFYLNDIRGSKTELIDNSAGSIVSYWYNDFGEVSEERNEDYEEFINEVQYTGAVYDSSTGLLYLNARFYDPSTGRFISQDSYRGERDEPDTWHLYVYCDNDPVNYVDNDGDSRKSSKTKRGQRNGARLETLGWGITFIILGSKGVTFPFACIDFLWLNNKVKTRYKKGSLHVYKTIFSSSGLSGRKMEMLVRLAKRSGIKSLFSSKVLKRLFSKVKWAVGAAASLYSIQGKTSIFDDYLDYQEVSYMLTIGANTYVTSNFATDGKGTYTYGIGISTSPTFVGYGIGKPWFWKWATNIARS